MRLQTQEIANISRPDFIPGPGVFYAGRWYLMGQCYHTEGDEILWIENRLFHHAARTYKGFWSMRDSPARAGATALNIAGGDLLRINDEAIEDGVRIPANAPASASWALGFAETVAPGIVWESTLRSAATGAIIAQATPGAINTGAAHDLPGLPAGSYLWHVRLKEAARAYVWPPPDYQTIAGRRPDDPAFAWEHPTLGTVYFNPLYAVGLVPPDAAHPLRIAFAQALAAGQVVKVPAWVTLLVYTNPNGSFVLQGGEYSSLRVIAGAGAWMGDTACHIDSTAAGPVLWSVLADAAGKPVAGALPAPVQLDPTARIGGAAYIEPEDGGALWLGLMIGSRNGRATRLLALQGIPGADAAADSAVRIVAGGQRFCECALSNEAPNSIARFPDLPLAAGGAIHAVTFCSRLRLQQSGPPAERLSEAHPGGRALFTVDGGGGEQLLFLTESDFARNENYAHNFNYIVAYGPRGLITGPGTAHHIFDALWPWAGSVYGIEETQGAEVVPRYQENAEQILDNYQYLATFNGGPWERRAGWKLQRFDMGAGSAAGAQLVVTGETGGTPGADMRPMAMRYDGNTVQRADAWKYFVRRIQPAITPDGRQVAAFSGFKEGAPGIVLPGAFYAYTSGEPTQVIFVFNGADGFCTTAAALAAAGYDWADLPPFLLWMGNDCWRGAAQAPGEGRFYLILQPLQPDGRVCYALPPGVTMADFPYDTMQYDALGMSDPDACFVPVPTPTNPVEALLAFPPGSTIATLAYPGVGPELTGELSKVIVGGFLAPGAPQYTSLQQLARDYPSWLWAGIDVPGTITDGPRTPADNAWLALHFTQRARFGRETILRRPARKNVVIAYIVPAGAAVKLGLAPRQPLPPRRQI